MVFLQRFWFVNQRLKMKIRQIFLACCCFLIWSSAHAYDAVKPPIAVQGSWQVMFAPWDNIEGAIVDAVESAKKQILVHAYLLTSRQIANSLLEAHRRGVQVQLLVDAQQAKRVKSSKVMYLVEQGISVWGETRYRNAHNKVIVIDAMLARAITITGSYNFTWSAQRKNAENMLFVRDNRELAARYAQNWMRHKKNAVKWTK